VVNTFLEKHSGTYFECYSIKFFAAGFNGEDALAAGQTAEKSTFRWEIERIDI